MTFERALDLAQLASGVAALVAVWLAVVAVRAGRRVPLTDAYMGAWQSILDVLAEATERRSEPPPEERADGLLRLFRAADHQLSVIEATLRVRLYGREVGGQVNNLLIDVLFDNPDIRTPDGGTLTLADMPRPEWADCTDDQWLGVVNSVPFASMLVSQVWDLPGRPDDHEGLMRWYYPVVLRGLDATDSVTAPGAAPQMQLAFMLDAYVDAFLLPWIRDASREALMGRIGMRGYRNLWRQRRYRWRYAPPWRRLPPVPDTTLFRSTGRR